MIIEEVILKPLVTEKAMDQTKKRKYAFNVARGATKDQIKKSIERKYKVKVEKVAVMNMNAKKKRVGRTTGYTSSWRKAVITLKEGDKIEVLEKV